MKVMISYQCETQDEAQAVLSAVAAALGKEPHACSKQYIEPTEVEKNTSARNMLDTVEVARKNINPGEPSIGKIGANTKEEIMRLLKIGTRPQKYIEHLKLLWSRGEVGFDGTDYYIL